VAELTVSLGGQQERRNTLLGAALGAVRAGPPGSEVDFKLAFGCFIRDAALVAVEPTPFGWQERQAAERISGCHVDFLP
jgi:hypothetical protein